MILWYSEKLLRHNRVLIQEAHQDKALGPDPNEQLSSYDTPCIAPSTIEPPRVLILYAAKLSATHPVAVECHVTT